MRYNVISVIETWTEGEHMQDKNRAELSPKPVIIQSESDSDLKENNPDDSLDNEQKDNYHRSEAKSNRNGLFHRVKVDRGGISQNVNVNVKIEQSDDPCTGCFKAIVGLFK